MCHSSTLTLLLYQNETTAHDLENNRRIYSIQTVFVCHNDVYARVSNKNCTVCIIKASSRGSKMIASENNRTLESAHTSSASVKVLLRRQLLRQAMIVDE